MIDQKIALINEPKTPLELAKMILEMAWHGDYSNGNTAPDGAPGQGIDEGQVMAGDTLKQYQIRLDVFEQMAGRVQNRRTAGIELDAEECPVCKGDRVVQNFGSIANAADLVDCYECRGTGRIPKRVTVAIRTGWEGEGRTGQYLGRVMKDQWWAIVVWDDEEDPETFKFAGLTISGSTQF